VTERVLVLGAGSWGTTLARHLALRGRDVTLWGHDPRRTNELALRRESTVYLPGVRLPDPVRVEDALERAFAAEPGLVVLAVPSHAVRAVLDRCRPLFPADASILIATKGIEVGTLHLMTAVARESLGVEDHRLAVLSGPSFALEVARGHPTAVVVASSSGELAASMQSSLSSETLRLYTNDDPIGVQVCGALKNVVAIASGVITGMGLGSNSVAALITRGLAEMQRLGLALGGRPSTFAGLAGIGDLVLTATGELSRNRRVGIELGIGRSPAEILSGMTMVAEGVRTADAAHQLAARESVEMPIVDQVRRVLYDGISPGEAISELMARRLRSEH
jgi:glycerol-3-phosphate dehydrogenase (NAD(P)+)